MKELKRKGEKKKEKDEERGSEMIQNQMMLQKLTFYIFSMMKIFKK